MACPAGHQLIEFYTPEDDYSCSRCECEFPKKTLLYDCSACDYDLCRECYSQEDQCQSKEATVPPESVAATAEATELTTAAVEEFTLEEAFDRQVSATSAKSFGRQISGMSERSSRHSSKNRPSVPTFEVVGGADTGGIVVRQGVDLKSEACGTRLSTGAVVEQLELVGQRLHYKLMTGTGPEEGWVSLTLKGKDLLVQQEFNIGIDKLLTRHHAHVGFKDLYDYDPKKSFIGEGQFATVFEARHKGTDEKHAVKMISFRRQSELEAVNAELKILIQLDHPNVMKFYEYFQEPRLIYLVTELCTGGTFISYFESGMGDPEDSRILFKDVVSAVHYCHKNNVLHRDIKPENCLIYEPDGMPIAKVIDFGVSKVVQKAKKSEDMEHEMTGTPFWRAPEVFNVDCSYGPKADMYSIGVMLFLCLTGTHPLHKGGFMGPSIGAVENTEMYTIDEEILDEEDVAEAPRDLIMKLMEIDKGKRLSAHEALMHSWIEPPSTKKFKKKGRNTKKRQSCGGLSDISNIVDDKMRKQKEAQVILRRATNFVNLDPFHAAILRLIAHHSHADEVESLRENFESVDTDQSGTVDKSEMQAALKANGMDVSEEDLGEIFSALDSHGKGEIRYSEWIAATMKPDIVKADFAVNEVWCFFDTDNSGKIEFEEIKEVLGKDIANECLEMANTDSFTKSEFQEYMALLADEQMRYELLQSA